jgi:hypothetical protein
MCCSGFVLVCCVLPYSMTQNALQWILCLISREMLFLVLSRYRCGRVFSTFLSLYLCKSHFPLLFYRKTAWSSCKWPTWRTIIFSIYLFPFSTCFEQLRTHHQENQLYRYIWYVSLCVGDRLVCRSGRNFLPDLHTRRSPTQSDTYQMLYWYNWIPWWWARGCSKHVENGNKYIEKRIVRHVGHLQELYWDARSTEHKNTVRSVCETEWFQAMSLENHQCWELEPKEEEGVFLDQKFIHVSK